ncbi:MAG TPA: MogA/MoaB family molybdenum cofactor biosynthesis protein [Mycobacteriales bacterium]|nr:MogA/MoaB family molybdenum cofactor biosynthesis protein [Mycobacteriales bacterium]
MSSEALPADARARVITVSDRSHGGLRHDTSGPVLAELLQSELGFSEAEVVVVPDEIPEIEAALRAAISAGVDLVVTTGGTGFAPRDVTPEATRRVLDKEAPGLAEALRQCNRDTVPTTILSRAVAGVAGTSIVVNLPGSTGAVRDGIAVLQPVIGHAIVQLRGGDH